MKFINNQSIAEHNTKVLFWGTLFGSVNFLEPVLVLFYFKRGLDAHDIFALLLCFSLSILIFEVPTGAFADRFGPKASFLVGSIINVMAKVVLIFAYHPWLFYVSRILDGLAATFFSGADETLIYESLKEAGKEETMSEVWGKIQSAAFIPMIASFVLGGFLAKDLLDSQFNLLIALGAFFYVIQFVVLLVVKVPETFDHYRDNPFNHVKNGIAIIKGQPKLIKLFLNFTIVMIPTFVFAKFDQPYLTGAGLPVAWMGVVYAAASFVSLILSRNVKRIEKLFPRPVILAVSGVLVAAVLLIGAFYVHSIGLAIMVLLVVKTSTSIRYPVYSHMSNQYIPSGSRATTISLLSVMDSFMDVLIFLTLSLTAGYGLKTIFIGCAVIILWVRSFQLKRRLLWRSNISFAQSY